MWTRRVARESAAAAAVALALLFVPTDVRPQQAAEELIATVRANGVARGEFTVLRVPAGDYWVAAADLPRLGIAPVEGARRALRGEAYYSLKALGAVTLAFNEAELSLTVDFPAEKIEGTRLDLAHRLPPLSEIRPQNSLILSYRLAMRRNPDRAVQTQMHNDLNVRVRGLLLRQEMQLRTGMQGRRFIRGPSQAVWDSPSRGTRAIAGDVFSSAGRFGTTITGGGLLYSRLFELTPELIKQPTATLQAATQLPAEVEVSVDGSTVMHARVGPGPITLSNLQSYGGTRNVRVVVTDIAGRREVFEQPFLFTDQVLARGVHDFSYFLGRRSDLGDERIRYREVAWQATHAYGATDAVTVAAGGEGSREFTNLGAGVTLRSDRLGLISTDVLTSIDRERDSIAKGWSARYAYVVPRASFQLSRRRYGAGFRSFITSPQRPFLREESRASATVNWLGISWGADLMRSEDALERRRIRQLRASAPLGRRASVSAQYQNSVVNGVKDWSAQVFLRLELDERHWVSASLRGAPGTRGADLETGRQVGSEEGFGYRAGTIANLSDTSDVRLGYLSGIWNLKPVSLDFYASSPLRGGSGAYAEAAVSGAVVAVDGFMGFTRRVTDSFVVANLGVPQAGVEVLLNNQVMGRSDASGKVFIPDVVSYSRQSLSLNDKQLGMDYNVQEKRAILTLPYRSGAVVDFGARKMRALTGMIWLRDGVRRVPAGAARLTLQGPAGTLVPETGPAGDFYLEDAPPGRYTGRLERDGKAYSCSVTIPDFAEPVHELKEGIVCD